MSVNQYSNQNLSYGLSQPEVKAFNPPIVSKRSPGTKDFAPVGTVWVNTVTNQVYTLAGIAANSATWVSSSGGGGSFSSVTANPGDITATAGNITATAGTVTAGNGLVASAGGITATGNSTISGGSILLNPTGGNISVDPAVASITSPASTLTQNARLGAFGCVGFTTAGGGATQAFTITNSNVTSASSIMANVTNLSTTASWLSIANITPTANTIVFTIVNTSAATAVNGNFLVTYWVMD